MLIPVLVMSQTKNVVNTNRVFAKVDKVLEFEKALAAHSQKYHTGDWKWRVSEISSGPDAGGYLISEGPVSWEQLDSRGNLGNEHNVDWNKNVTPFLTDRGSSGYSEYEDSLSTIGISDYADKIYILHFIPKPGHGNVVYDAIKKFVPVNKQKSGDLVATYSQDGSFAIVFRMKDGLKEMSAGYRPDIKPRYEAVHGAGSFEGYIHMLQNDLEKVWGELLFYRKDLSSK